VCAGAHNSCVRLLAPVTVGLVALALTTGCGSSRGRTVGPHSAAPRYTVQEVEAAFAQHGIHLHRLPPRNPESAHFARRVSRAVRQRIIRQIKRDEGSLISLQGGHVPHRVGVVVETRRSLGISYTSVNSIIGPPHKERFTTRGNVIAVFDPDEREAVTAALGDLH
jgi:hypothetical protein